MFSRVVTHTSVAVLLTVAAAPRARSQSIFESRLQAIMSRPEFRHSRFGVEFYSLDEGCVLYARNPQELFIPGSASKILSVGTALELSGPGFRFHTRVSRTGEAGEPNLSGSIQSDGSLAFQNEDAFWERQNGTRRSAGIEVHSPAAGHVFAKTGTYGGPNALKGGGVINGKGLVGFVDTKDGRAVASAAYINFFPISNFNEEDLNKAGQAIGEIAAAANDGL